MPRVGADGRLSKTLLAADIPDEARVAAIVATAVAASNQSGSLDVAGTTDLINGILAIVLADVPRMKYWNPATTSFPVLDGSSRPIIWRGGAAPPAYIRAQDSWWAN